ncbi:hypothetical protein Bca4012_027818 [Brassica carinata]
MATARDSVGVLLQRRSTPLLGGVAFGGVFGEQRLGFVLSGSRRRRVARFTPSELSPGGGGFAMWAWWDLSSQHRWLFFGLSGGWVPHLDASILFWSRVSVVGSALCSSGSLGGPLLSSTLFVLFLLQALGCSSFVCGCGIGGCWVGLLGTLFIQSKPLDSALFGVWSVPASSVETSLTLLSLGEFLWS